MALETYVWKDFRGNSLAVIDMVNEICEEYAAQGFDLTLRQLYYQFVARGLIPNKDSEYKRLGSIVNDGRLAGLIDWDYIVDRTRFIRRIPDYANPGDAIDSAADRYAEDLWIGQDYRPEVWIEKDALIGVIEDVCRRWRVPYFSCRGYVSQSEMYDAAQRMIGWGMQTPVIFHLGDHDPSGIDMTRDITDRLNLFGAGAVVQRLGLDMSQVNQYNPPPNPAKLTDARAQDYIRRFGGSSWELDALEPQVLSDLIDHAIQVHVDYPMYEQAYDAEQVNRARMKTAADTIRQTP